MGNQAASPATIASPAASGIPRFLACAAQARQARSLARSRVTVARAATLVALTNRVLHRPAAGLAWSDARRDMSLYDGDRIATKKRSEALLAFEQGGQMRIEADSIVAVERFGPEVFCGFVCCLALGCRGFAPLFCLGAPGLPGVRAARLLATHGGSRPRHAEACVDLIQLHLLDNLGAHATDFEIGVFFSERFEVAGGVGLSPHQCRCRLAAPSRPRRTA